MIYIPDRDKIFKEKMLSNDRILVIRPMDGKKPTSGTGLIDVSLFSTGGNQLHAMRDPLTTLWYFKYERGVLPTPLKQRWTSWTAMLAFATKYFKNRNLQIVEVID
jgi:hypothetical protein